MSTALRVIGDGLSIAALAIIASTALQAWKRIPRDVTIPMHWGRNGQPNWRTSRAIGLLWIPTAAMAIIFAFTLSGATFRAQGLEAMMLLCVRAALAAILAMAQLAHLRAVIRTLQGEGRL